MEPARSLWPENGEVVVEASFYELGYAPVGQTFELMFGVDQLPNTLSGRQPHPCEESSAALLTVENFQDSVVLGKIQGLDARTAVELPRCPRVVPFILNA